MVYLLMVIFSTFFAALIKNNKKVYTHSLGSRTLQISARHILIFLAALPAFFVSAFRYGIGTDYFFSYVPQFNNVLHGVDTYFEPLFYFIVRLMTLVSDNYQIFFVGTSLAFIFFCYKSMYDQAAQITMSVVLFFLSRTFFVSLNNVRQSIATAIVLYALQYFKRDKILQFIIWVVIAGLVHQVAFLYLVIVLLSSWRITGQSMMLISIMLLAARQWVGPVVIALFAKSDRFKMYVEDNSYAESTLSLLEKSVNVVLLIMLAYIDIRYKSQVHDTKEFTITKWLQIGMFTCCVFDGIVPATYRIARVFSFPQFITIPNAIAKCKDIRERRLFNLLTLLMFAALLLQMYTHGAEEVFPYQSIFNR